MIEHAFTDSIRRVLKQDFGSIGDKLFEASPLLQYLNLKTKSADRGSKSRANCGNLYAIYVLVEDYVQRGFDRRGDYSKYEGAVFSSLFQRQRKLPFGSKLQNHHLNRLRDEAPGTVFPSDGDT